MSPTSPTPRRWPAWLACAAALLARAPLAAASLESDAVLANFGPLEWIGGINQQDASNTNASEWLPEYEGLPATAANLSEPHSAIGDLQGNIYVADKNAHAIRRIDRNGLIHTVAGTNTPGFNGDGPARLRQLNGPQNAYPIPDGSYYILDTGNQRIRRVDSAGQMTTLIVETSGLSRGLWVQRDGALLYYCTNTALKRWTPALGTNPGTVMAQGFSECGNLDVAENGDIYLTDRGALTNDPTASQVFRIAPNATPATFTPQRVAGTGGSADSGPIASGTPALNTGLNGVRGIAFHPAGGYFLATHKGGDLWYVDRSGLIQLVVRGDNGNAHTTVPLPLPATATTYIAEPRFVSLAPNGDLLLATNDAGFIRRARYLGPLPTAPPISILPPASPGGPIQLTWPPTGSLSWLLESSPLPHTDPWRYRQSGPGSTSPGHYADPISSSPRQFYRLRVFRAWPN